MTIIPYTTVYDVRETTHIPAALLVLVGLAWAGGVALTVGRNHPRLRELFPFREFTPDQLLRVGFFTAFVAFCGGGILFVERSDRERLVDRLAHGEYVTVEGPIRGFVPGDGHREESWYVESGGRTYAYRYNSSEHRPGFHQSAGPVHAGVRVRLLDVNGHIARLEVAPDGSASTPVAGGS